jgi:rhodanese-related sulfurtransferase
MIKKTLILFVAVLFMACGPKQPKEYAGPEELVKATAEKVNFISAEELKAVIDAHKQFYLIDIRETEEFDSACINAAVNIPRGVLEGSVSDKAPKHRQMVYVYCSKGDRSTLAAATLAKLKYANVKVLKGGFDNFKVKFPEMIELNPVRGGETKKAAAKPSGGCGG